MIRPLAGWMLVQPLQSNNPANPQLRVGRIHAVGAVYDDELADKIPFQAKDRVCWVDDTNVHVMTEHLVLVPLQAVLAYEEADDDEQPDG